ncbi:MAGE-like protein 2 [Manduca sexta]|uniref:MAGE-like protein 2 n=1 Tax=Manduca sexta TaxID=7130 RepID=UPI001890567C|nr:MAGE-like protein 2 [Manduca sexta]XP_037292638.1 MAGE-like protein 2 [Manduca sexta]XP_037292639.1 MAGE-like protein 2 [Manduca sexta]
MSDYIEDLDKFLAEYGMLDSPSGFDSFSELGEMLAMNEHAAPELVMPPLRQQQAAPELVMPPPRQQHAAPELVMPPLRQQQAAPELVMPPPRQQHAAPELVMPPLRQQQAAPELVMPPLRQQQAAPELVMPPPRQQQAAPELVMPPPRQQQAAPELVMPPPRQQQAAPELVMPPPRQQQAAPELVMLPPRQQHAVPELVMPPPRQQQAAPELVMPPPRQQQAAPELVMLPPRQQHAAPELQPAPRTPISLGVPSKEPFKHLPFTVKVLLPKEKPKHYIFTRRFNLALVKPDLPFAVQFNYGRLPGNKPMYVRAMPVFANPIQAGKRVETCRNHYDKLRPARGEVLAKSVLHSYQPGPGVYQQGEPANPQSRFSIVVPATGTQIQHIYEMKCTKKCFRNMTHRALEIIFTLEDMWGNAYARHVMGLQSCSSPFRDLKNMLKNHQTHGKRAQTPSTRSSGRKRPRLLSVESESIDSSTSEVESIDVSRIASAANNIETNEQHFEPPLPDAVVNSSAVTLASIQCLTDDLVRDYGCSDPRVVQICQTYLNPGIQHLREILPPQMF